MKKVLVLAALFAIVAVPAMSAVVGSPHDMSLTFDSSNTTTQVCVYCHTPHGAQTDGTPNDQPLWNRTTAAITGAVYTSTTLGVTSSVSSDAKLCLSCHDGSTNITAVGNPPNDVATAWDQTTALVVTGNLILDTDLSNDHPIGFDYPATDAATALVEELILDTALNTNIQLFTATNQVWCSSCHDVHGKDDGTGTSTDYDFFLRDTMDGSALCLDCHVK